MDIQDVINDSEGNSLLLSHFSRSPFCDVCGIVSLRLSVVTSDRICEKGPFDRFFKIEFSSHSSATRIALNGDLIRAYHTVHLSRKTGLIIQNN